MAKSLSVLIIVLLIGDLAICQVRFARYFQENLLPAIDNKSYPEVKFAWSMAGKTQAAMNNGLAELGEDNPDVAIHNFDEVIQQLPTFLPAFYYRGVCYKLLEDFDKAQKDFEAAIAIDPKSSETWILLGEIYQQRSKLEKAESCYDKAIGINPTFIRGYFNLSMVEFTRGNTRKSIKYIEKCHELDPKFPNAYLMEGLIKFNELSKNKNKSAIVYFDQAIKCDSLYREALFWRGLSYLYLEQPAKAIGDWDKLVLYNPENSFFVTLRGFLNIELENFDEAFNDLRKAIMANPENEEHFRRGETLLDKRIDIQYATSYAVRFSYGLDEKAMRFFRKGFCFLLAEENKKAIENFKAAEKIQPSATVYFLEALAFEHQEKHDSALIYYDKALALDNEIVDAHKKRAIYRYELKDWKGAYADLNEMARLQPQLMLTYRLRGLIKAAQKDYYGAIIDLSKYLKSDTADFEILNQRGVCRSQIGDERGANDDFRKSLKYDRFNWRLYEYVAKSYVTLKDTASALETLSEYSEAMPERIAPFMYKTELFLGQRKWDDAQQMIDQALKRFHPEYFDKQIYSRVIFLKGQLNYHLKNYSISIQEFNKALDTNPTNLEALYYRGKAYIGMGEKKRAISDFKRLKQMGYADSETILQSLLQ
jgi:tetratricopeptide (TPR) repeat protein